MLETLLQDARYALRTLFRDKAFFAAAVAIIALGIGANTAVFSVVNTILFRPLPFRDSPRLVWVANCCGDGGLSSVTSRVANYLDWRAMNQSFEDMTAFFAFFDYGTYTMVGAGEPERLVGANIAHNFLPFLGVQPQLGRNFSEAECKWNGARAAILSHNLWQRRFAADPNVIGRSITLNDQAVTIVGVLPASFDFASTFAPGSRVDMLVPFPLTEETDRWGNTLSVIGRLKPGVSVQQAQAEFTLLSEQIRTSKPNRWQFGSKLTPLQDHLTARFQRGFIVLLCAVAAVLLIACTNLSNLLLARAASRRKELAIRAALGAGRFRLIRQMLTECFLVTAIGAAMGLALAYAALRLLVSLQGISIPLISTVRLDSTALLFTAAAAVVTGIVFGIVPALHASAARDSEALNDAGRGSSEGRRAGVTRGVLVVSEVALACMLLIGAGLLIRSFLRLLDVDLGFRPESAAVWRIDTGDRYKDAASRAAFLDRLVRAVEAVPGVDSAGVTDALPLSRDRSWGAAAKGVQYGPGQFPLAHPRLVDWRYIRTMRIPLISGREFNEHDTATSRPVVIINKKMARSLWPDRDAVGQYLVNNQRDIQVVGVVGNVRHQNLEEEGALEMYFPLTQSSNSSVELVVRTKVPPQSLVSGVRSALTSIDPTLPTAEFKPLGALVDTALSPRRFMMILLGIFAFAALVLASVGIYGVVATSVSRRTQEIGIRMALGATASQVQRHVLSRTVALVSCGVALGVLGSLALARLASSLLFQMEPEDPATFGITVTLLFGVAVLAGYLPARRASRVDPLSALRAN